MKNKLQRVKEYVRAKGKRKKESRVHKYLIIGLSLPSHITSRKLEKAKGLGASERINFQIPIASTSGIDKEVLGLSSNRTKPISQMRKSQLGLNSCFCP
jgi:hypothetical protein